jgi:hypothetical protein
VRANAATRILIVTVLNGFPPVGPKMSATR